ncbi:hypothetical protein PF007_g13334 [Phytophthora fragariae]|uniref:Uncharacterized protein n=1 Tax=Phytophthora fragariae TaxID=53985 RepID=A0A6A3FCH1_9STRA|nr:hypothetical protein PF009_g10458 [Phytophthora fragariae]KAE9106608.1 hypothetical protein PF007_g13334 [Phytophthora fragariae]KAE9183131.1 hypothetical protein PF004_g24039 [Phytophthora fragariae]
MHADQGHSQIWRVGDKPDVTSSSRRRGGTTRSSGSPTANGSKCQQVSSADYGQGRWKRQPHRRRKHRVSVANETGGDDVSWSR